MKEYNIGLDIGTNSVGWAVVEENTQKIIKKASKALWGVRLFEDATTAAGRRNCRSTRRKYDRRRKRIELLQEEFKPEINKIDSLFFTKLKESKYNKNDLLNKSIEISAEERGKIKEYNQKYPTIYHLRRHLIEDKEKEDIRLVYLAIHHMIKYRGNFLYNSENFNVNNLNIEEKLDKVFSALNEMAPNLDISENYSEVLDLKRISDIVISPSKNDIKAYLKEELEKISDNKKFINEFIKLMVGNKFNVKDLLMIDEIDKIMLSFDDSTYDAEHDKLQDILGDSIEVIDAFKQLYDCVFLKKIFKGSNSTSLSALMVERYNVHKKDLKFLKEILNADRKVYNDIFRSKTKKCLYEKYIHNELSYEEFKKDLLKSLETVFDNLKDVELIEDYNLNRQRIENGDFLPRITETENGRYPYQLNKDELIKILENQGKYYPFLLEKATDTYKIVKLLEFRIPYYVGPLNTTTNLKEVKNTNAWLVKKKDNIRITPYNFDEVIDKSATAELFIKRMISHCTYLLNEYALPNNSILYSRYKVMNELKQIKVNGEKITNDIQHKIITELFEKLSGTITDTKFKMYLYSSSDFNMYNGDINVTGYSADGKFANNLQPYIDFFGENGIFVGTEYTEKDAEQIIEWITIFDDKDILEEKVRKEYNVLDDQQIKKIIDKKYSGWGSLSKKLLTEKYYMDKETNLKKSILDLMYETDENFMQIINKDEYGFQTMIKENNILNDSTKLNYSLVKELSTSPATKRGIYQALKIVDELVKYIGYEPKNIMIEMARSEERKERKDDRKKYLIKLYEKFKNEIKNYNQLMSEMKNYEKIDTQRLFLYFIQEGKCLYTGTPLNIEDLSTYEIDHIIPRTLIKDDSIDNKALVLKECNQIKKAGLVLPSEYRTSHNTAWWTHLRKIGLMSASKFYKLTRKTYSDEDIQGFINRQLVETRQITKHVANILNNFYKNTKVIYLKANFSHNYREKYELFKFREINDYHHAHDAYLAAVLGEYKEKYMKINVDYKMVAELNNRLKELGNYNKLKYGYVINSLDSDVNDIVNELSKKFVDIDTGEVLFDAEKFNKTIENTLYRNDILISKKTEIRTGEFYNQTKQIKGKKGVPLKINMPTEMYGSYTSLNPAYATMINYTKNGQKIRRIIGFPIYLKSLNEVVVEAYYRKLLGLKKEELIRVENIKIPFYSYLIWNDQLCYLVGASDKVEVCNAKQFKYDKQFMKNHKKALNEIFNKKETNYNEYQNDINEIITYIVDKIESDYKLFENLIPELKIMVSYKKYENFTVDEKVNIIKQLTKLLNCKSDNANFKFLNEKYSSAFGKKHGRTIESAKISSFSVTGIFCNRERQI